MRRTAGQIPSLDELRRRVELSLAASPIAVALGREPLDLPGLVHELQVHQAELELQNEEFQLTSLELEKSRDRYFEIYDLAPVGHLNLDLAGTILDANHTATALVGGDRAKLLGRKLSSLLSAADGDRFHLHRQEALGGTAAVVCEVSLRKVGGDVCPVYIRSKALRNLQGNPEGFLCVLFDLSELRRAEERLQVEEARSRESEARLREIAEHVEDALMLREEDGTFAYVSPAFERIWARPAAEILGDAAVWEASVHPADRGRLRRAQARLEAGEPFEETFRIRRPNDEIRWVRCRLFPFEPVPGERPRYVGVSQDVTASRAREEELRQAQKMEAVGALASAIAHDFGNLLQGIMGCTSVALASETLPERRREYLDRILEAVKRGSGLVGQLMAFSRKKSAEPRPIRLDEMIDDAAALLERLLGEHIRLEIRTAAPGGVILADPVQIEQVLLNLAANARDAMPEVGTLTIETAVVPGKQPHEGPVVRIVVRDTGVGMDEETRARVFEPYFTTKPIGVGTGIGLSTVLGITQGLGGSVEVESELGRGTSFVFHFPCVKEKPASAVRVGPRAERRFRGRALLIEDHYLVRMTVRHYLEELGFEVLEASSAARALELCDANAGPVALCVSDVSLPGGSGPKVMGTLRARYPDLRSLFITAHPTNELVARGVLDEAAPALQKPFGKPELAAKLAAKLATLLPGN